MEFRTIIPIAPREPKIDYSSKIFLLGSCFVENIGAKLDYYKFQTLQNPFGILFHPAAILNFLKAVRSEKEFSETDIFFHNERWHSFAAHSALSSSSKNGILEQLNSAASDTLEFLKSATHIILTFGTAWAYRLKDSREIVANCHKLPQQNFSKGLTDPTADLKEILQLISEINPSAEIILTVSPVRHFKDGFVENQRSKARLVTAVHEVLSEKISYFPAYEIVIDELRDYRFFAEDMIHPNELAVEYVWERFMESRISPETRQVMKRVEEIQKGLSHRPFDENSEAHQLFRRKLQDKIDKLQKDYPKMIF